MLAFPQLNSGAMVQAPFRRTRTTRTAANRLADGSEVRGPDQSATQLAWEAQLSELSDEELDRIAALFDAVEGRVGTFLFLDPAGNLLQWSENLSQNCWQKGAMLQLTRGIADPLGGTGAVRVTNAGQSAQDVMQALTAPATFVYCFSVYARAAAPGAVSLLMAAGQSRQLTAHAVGATWQRLTIAWPAEGGVDQMAFGVELPAGASVELFGFQAEAQPTASSYRKTFNASGVLRERGLMGMSLRCRRMARGGMPRWCGS
jgi:Conserved hypothetical protein 2217 (DUF2460)